MRNIYLLRPFPKVVHLFIWLAYFGWISWGNIDLHGVSHIQVLLLAIPLMLGIIYMNRYWFRKLIRLQRINRKTISWMVVIVLMFFLVLYLQLYVWPTSFTELMLPEPAAHRFWWYVLDFIAFYWSFAWKGIGLGLAEVTVSLLRWRRLTLKQQRLQTVIYKRQMELKRWIAHFQGNIAQRTLRITSSGVKLKKRSEAYLALSSRCVRVMAIKDMTVPLADEFDGLRELATLLGDYPIVLNLPEQTYSHQVVPMMLLGLFKNMCKHGEFEDDALPAVFTVSTTNDKLMVYTDNQIAAHSAWIYQEGGTGLEQLKSLLDLYYGSGASLRCEQEDGRFRTWLTIAFNDVL